MKPYPEARLASRRVFSGRVVSVDVDTVGAPDQSTIELEIIPVLEMIRTGEIADAKSIVALLYVAGFCLSR